MVLLEEYREADGCLSVMTVFFMEEEDDSSGIMTENGRYTSNLICEEVDILDVELLKNHTVICSSDRSSLARIARKEREIAFAPVYAEFLGVSRTGIVLWNPCRK